MDTITNPKAKYRKRILCAGCSWSRSWPGMMAQILQVDWISGGGKSLGWIREQVCALEWSAYDAIIIQVPTPIRSIKNTGLNTRGCLDRFMDESRSLTERLCRKLTMDQYRQDAYKLASTIDGVLFFVYNVGGYPFRCPYEFGDDSEKKFTEWLTRKRIRHTLLSFEGKPGYAKVERAEAMPDQWFNPIDSPGHRIHDPHPNPTADALAAKHIEEVLIDAYFD